MAFRICKVKYRHINGVEPMVEVTADSLYEAVELSLTTFRDTVCVREIGHDQTNVTIVVKQPEVEHRIRIGDFEACLESVRRLPAGMILKSRLRQLLSKLLARPNELA
jgi:hypothetical protein